MASLSFTYTTLSAPTITLASLTTTSARQSSGINNSVGAIDHIAEITIGSPASSTSSTGSCSVYICPSADDGSTYAGGASGSDSAFSGRKENAILARTIDVVANSTTYRVTLSVAAACGFMPKYYSWVILNSSGGTLASGSIAIQSVNVQSA